MASTGGRGQDAVPARAFLGLLSRRWRIVVAAALLGIALGALAVVLLPTSYTAHAVVVVAPVPTDPLTGGGLSSRDISIVTESRIVASSSVADRAAALLGAGVSARGLRSGLDVTSVAESQVLDIGYTSSSATRSATLANAFADAYLSYRGDLAAARNRDVTAGLNRRILDLTNLLAQLPPDPRTPAAAVNTDTVTRASLTQEIADLRRQAAVLSGATVSPGQVVDRAEPPAAAGSLLRLSVIAGLILGALVGVALAMVRDRREDRIHSGAELADQLGAPTLLEVQASRSGAAGWVAEAMEVTTMSEDYRVLAVKLTSAAVSRGASTLLVVDVPDSAAATASHVAAALSSTGHTVALVASPERLAQHEQRPSEVPAALAVAARRPAVVALMDERGPATPAAVDVLRQLRGKVDWVVVDGTGETPSQLLALALAVDGALVTATRTRTSRRQLRALTGQLRELGTPILGAVLYSTVRGRRPAADTLLHHG